MRSSRRIASAIVATVCFAAGAPTGAQAQAPRKRLLVIGEEKGYRHEAVTHAMVTIARLGKDTGLWDTVIRTDIKGRVFYSTLGHVEANWDKPEMQTMNVEAIKWALKLVDADVTPRAAPR
jgi:hypothetical protein